MTLALSIAVLFLSLLQSCADLGDKERGEPCTSDSECDEEDGLSCQGGMCDYPADAMRRDS